MPNSPHYPVLLAETLDGLNIQKDDHVLDGTIGFGGHSEHILKKLGPNGHLFGTDQDPEAIKFCKNKFKAQKNVTLHNCNYSEFDTPITKALLDLGYSSFQLDHDTRGFSHQTEAPLDMRMNTDATTTAHTILHTYSNKDLSDMFYNLGDLKHNKNLVDNIKIAKRKNKLATTTDLVDIIKQSYNFQGKRTAYMKICAQVFQALRIEVNQEFEHLITFIQNIDTLLQPGGRLAIITFHSGEDRLVKHKMKELKNFKKVNKHVITATQEEIQKNSRSKPAKLRVYEKVTS